MGANREGHPGYSRGQEPSDGVASHVSAAHPLEAPMEGSVSAGLPLQELLAAQPDVLVGLVAPRALLQDDMSAPAVTGRRSGISVTRCDEPRRLGIWRLLEGRSSACEHRSMQHVSDRFCFRCLASLGAKATFEAVPSACGCRHRTGKNTCEDRLFPCGSSILPSSPRNNGHSGGPIHPRSDPTRSGAAS